MKLGSLTEKAKELVRRRGGTETLKEDAEELKDIATGEGSATDKAKEAKEALREPGAGESAAERPAAEEPRAPREEPRGAGGEPERGEPGGAPEREGRRPEERPY